jgi:hypothetical protein
VANAQSRNNWKFIETPSGQLKPGLDVASSDVGDFAIISNSAGGEAAKEYPQQMQLILEGLTAAQMVILRIEVDSGETVGLPLEQRVLEIDFPIRMEGVENHLELRKRISTAQKSIGQKLGAKGGNPNKRIRIHVTSEGISANTFVSELCAINGKYRLQTFTQASNVINQIHTLTKSEIQASIDEWKRDGRDAFFARHSVYPAVKYKIAVGIDEFDAKAIVVGALRTFRPELGDFKTSIFNGNLTTIAQPLRRLGFDVLDMEVEEIGIEEERHERELLNRGIDGPVEKIQLVKSRRGQGIFRDNVESREPKCRITGVTNTSYLRASHIRPWRKSSDQEKIDGNNGLMLAPHIDFLFDRGFISFEDDGTLIISNQIEDGVLNTWGIPSEMNVGPFSPEQSVFLKFHRENELKK